MSLSLNDPIQYLTGVGPKYRDILERIGITTVKDLIFHFPKRYIDTRKISTLKECTAGEYHTIKVKIDSHFVKKLRGFKKLVITSISDSSMTAKILWFNQEYIISTLKEGEEYLMYGKLRFTKTYNFNPVEVDSFTNSQILGHIVPIYSSTKGLTQKWLRTRLKYLDYILPSIYLNYHDMSSDIL